MSFFIFISPSVTLLPRQWLTPSVTDPIGPSPEPVKPETQVEGSFCDIFTLRRSFLKKQDVVATDGNSSTRLQSSGAQDGAPAEGRPAATDGWRSKAPRRASERGHSLQSPWALASSVGRPSGLRRRRSQPGARAPSVSLLLSPPPPANPSRSCLCQPDAKILHIGVRQQQGAAASDEPVCFCVDVNVPQLKSGVRVVHKRISPPRCVALVRLFTITTKTFCANFYLGCFGALLIDVNRIHVCFCEFNLEGCD